MLGIRPDTLVDREREDYRAALADNIPRNSLAWGGGGRSQSWEDIGARGDVTPSALAQSSGKWNSLVRAGR